jgi:hypothetical protein
MLGFENGSKIAKKSNHSIFCGMQRISKGTRHLRSDLVGVVDITTERRPF